MSSFVYISLFTHTGAINSGCYQQCGHSKTRAAYYQQGGQPSLLAFLTHTEGEEGGSEGRGGGRKKAKFPAHTEQTCFRLNMDAVCVVTFEHLNSS